MRVFGVLSLLISVLILAFIFTKFTGSLSSGGSVKTPINQAQSVKDQSDLVTLKTKLNLYFQENSHYPQGLNELDNYGLDTNLFNYKLCTPQKVSIELHDQKAVLENGSETSNESC